MDNDNIIIAKIINPPPTRTVEGHAQSNHATSVIHVGPFKLAVNTQELIAALQNTDAPQTKVSLRIL
jgi:hypothetical protein